MEGGLRLSNPVDLSGKNPSEQFSGLEQGELDARRATINSEDAWVSWHHECLFPDPTLRTP
jgi:hypothetical protein